VVDPRVTMLAQFADMHLAINPGTDLVLLNSLAHVIIDEDLADFDYIEKHTNGVEEFKAVVEEYDPTSAAKVCGIDEDTIRHVARLYANAGQAMSIWTMGINQSTHGSDGVVGINNLNLITGNIGKPGGTSLSITGQSNAMGTREWSSCSGLPGHRALENADHRKEIADFWGIDPEFLPKQRGLLQTDIFPAIETGQIKGLWLIGTNPMTSMPNTSRIRKTLEKLDFLVVQDAYSDVETTQFAHMFLPRRVNRVTNVSRPFADSKPDLWIFSNLAKRFENGLKMRFSENAEDMFEEMKTLSKGAHRNLDISGMSYEKIEKNRGLQWPCREGDEKGAQRLYADGKFLALPFVDNNERPDADYPYWLNSGRVVEHFHTRTRTGKIGNMNKYSPALEQGIEHQSYVRVISRRGDAVVMVQLTQRIPRDMVFIPFHFHDCVNRLTLGLLDPHSRQPAFKQNAVRIEQVDQREATQRNLEARDY